LKKEVNELHIIGGYKE